MKYCRKCVKKLNDDSVFCDGCGTKVLIENHMVILGIYALITGKNI